MGDMGICRDMRHEDEGAKNGERYPAFVNVYRVLAGCRQLCSEWSKYSDESHVITPGSASD
jgi:hypothetical protein